MFKAGKCIAAAIAFAGVASGGQVAAAQGATSVVKPVSFGISAGVAVPTGDLANGSGDFPGVNTGYDVTGSLAVALPVVPFGLRGDISYSGFGGKPGRAAQPGGNVDPKIDTRILGFTANVVFPIHLPAPILRPYVIGGIGEYNVRLSPTGENNTSQTNFGYNIGAGVALPFVLFDGFIEARYHSVKADNVRMSFIPITVGVMF